MPPRFAGEVALATAEGLQHDAAAVARIGGYARRQLDWAFQSNLAAGDRTQIL